ncbi:MAG: hypothetical protein QOF84_808 [Streptomyces sp.]|nr:hypothetical protein [Streptomyces sp.]
MTEDRTDQDDTARPAAAAGAQLPPGLQDLAAAVRAIERGERPAAKATAPAPAPAPSPASASASAPSASAACTFTSFLVSYLVKTGPPVSLTYGTHVTLAGFAHFFFLLLHERLGHACGMLLSLQQ